MQLDVRLDGFDDPIGSLTSDDRGALRFIYSAAYLQRPHALALSLALPLGDEAFNDFATRAYFDNLLQERDTARADIIAKYRLSTDDIVGILYYLGKDCAGAVSVLPEGEPAIKIPGNINQDYVAYTDPELEELVQDPSPLAGVQSKIAVTVLPDGRVAEAQNGAPTTHILKVPQERHERDAAREHEAMMLSSELVTQTAKTEVRTIAGVPTLLVERFDRQTSDGRVTRLHQEDFCQALGLPARHKYQRPERGADGYKVAAIRAILDRTVDPAGERQRFLRITLFDILTGNVDGHAKNFALLHLPGNRLVTSPRYDVMPTMLDLNTTDEFAYHLGGATHLQELDRPALDDFLSELGLTSGAGRRRILDAAITSTIGELNGRVGAIGAEDKNFGDLIATNIRTFCRNLDIEAPEPTKSMDTFVR
jgi:serine/threonine-protein kinase HipA